MNIELLQNAHWHMHLNVLPQISGETVEVFVSSQSLAKETSIRGYKFFHESFIHDVQGMNIELCLATFCA
jgi:hypothetical protein